MQDFARFLLEMLEILLTKILQKQKCPKIFYANNLKLLFAILLQYGHKHSFCKILNLELLGWTFFWTFIFVLFQKSRSTFSHVFLKNQNRRGEYTIFHFFYKKEKRGIGEELFIFNSYE